MPHIDDDDPGIEVVYKCEECLLCAYARDRCDNVVRECMHPYGIDLKWGDDLSKISGECPLRERPLTIKLSTEE